MLDIEFMTELRGAQGKKNQKILYMGGASTVFYLLQSLIKIWRK